MSEHTERCIDLLRENLELIYMEEGATFAEAFDRSAVRAPLLLDECSAPCHCDDEEVIVEVTILAACQVCSDETELDADGERLPCGEGIEACALCTIDVFAEHVHNGCRECIRWARENDTERNEP